MVTFFSFFREMVQWVVDLVEDGVVQEEVEGEEILDLVVVVVVEEEGEDLMTRTSSQYQQTSVDWLLEKVANRDVLYRGVYCYGISVFYTDLRLKIQATDFFRKLRFLLESES